MDHAHDYTRVGAFNIIVSSIAEEVPGLTDEEKRQLEAVMRKAKEFDAEEENKMKKPLEGQLYKYTNVVKGWQYRWFVLTPETGMLEYYMMDEIKKHRPRGALHLAGAVISPSDEDNQSFNVSAVCGEVYKLKANDSKERHFWVNRLRLAAEHHSKIGPEKPVAVCKESSSTSQFIGDAPLVNSSFISYSAELTGKKIPQTACDVHNISSCKGIPVIENIPTLNDSLASIKESLEKAISNQKSLAKNIEDLPIDGPYLKCSDIALLLLKATSLAAVQSLEQCYLILRQRQLAITQPSGLPPGATVEWVDKSKPLNVNKSPAKKMTDALPKLP